MAYFSSAPTTTTTKQFLAVPAAPSRKLTQRLAPPVRNDIDDFLSSDADLDLELSFASTMSLHSPQRDALDLTSESESPDYAPMDISPAPQRTLPPSSRNNVAAEKPVISRPRALTSGARLFGRDMSNNSSVSVNSSGAKSTGTSSGGKRLQRAALPLEWMAGGQTENNYSQPQNVPSSPAASDAMDVDSSFVYVPSTATQRNGPLSAAPTVTAFDLGNNPLLDTQVPASAAPTVTTFNNLFYNVPSLDESSDAAEPYEDMASEAEVSQVVTFESPTQPFPKKRRSCSPMPQPLSRVQEHILEEEASLESSPAPSSPMVRKFERIASGPILRKPTLNGLGAPLELNANKKRPRRPALSAMVPPGEAPILQPLSAYPTTDAGSRVDKENGDVHVHARAHVLPPVRRAFSAMLPPNLLEQSMSSEDGLSFEHEGPDMSSPAQAYAKRQQVKTIRRCDGTDDFRPVMGATALVRRDSEAMMKTLRRSEEKEDRGRERVERNTPRSKYLNAGPGLGGFGDNEAHGKILPCHRVREDGLMRINSQTMDDLLDGVYDSQIASFYIVDCRFDYEYSGGHIPGAVNINTTAGVEDFLLGENVVKPMPSSSGDTGKKTVLVFHCEFSVKRAPTFAKHLRAKDRALNNHMYPKIHYPEVYILEGGYCQYYQDSAARCQPSGYVRMDDPYYAQSRKEDLDHFRKGKFGRTKSYAYGESKHGSAMPQQSKRNTVPSNGTTALFAAANAARTRRGASSGLQLLGEDENTSQQNEDEDTDVGDSPCPPPTKTVTFKGKKIGRLGRAETYDSARLSAGY